ncbi:H-NS histone family protein [Paucibacter soli]|uniref:H-NS histone family protein n=1 Tax=Paucibacter soli TaxID=3133433 RepID=UPI00403626E3
MEYWGIESAELGRIPSPALTSTGACKDSCPKYVHPVTGETWDGQGLQPEWLKRALTTDGFRVLDLIPSSASSDQHR